MADPAVRVTQGLGLVVAGVAVAGTAAGAAWAAVRDRARTYQIAASLSGGEPEAGRATIEAYGCAACHTIPGITRANATVGPSLDGVASRLYLAGIAENTPEHLIRWLQNPRAMDPLTAMPNLGLSEAEARDVAGYLYTLR